MKKIIKILASALALITVLSLCTVSLCANTVIGDNLNANWDTFSAKYSSNTDKAIPKATGNDLFKFEERQDGGIKVDVPDVKELPGVYATTLLESKYKTTLDNLTVTIDPYNFSFMPGDLGLSRSLCVIFTEKKVENIYTVDENKKSTGLYWGAQEGATNGLRHLLPTESKSICINIINQYWAQRRDEQMATSIQLIYFDGVTYNNGDGWENKGDGRPGYRWSYYASQQSGESNIQDGFGRTIYFEKIYTGKGLTFSFTPDSTHGYITCINGKEYYDAHNIMFFPDQNIPKTVPELDSGNYDVDFTALAGVEGYLGIGSVSNKDDVDNREDYAVVSVNGIPASQWKGEANTHIHTPDTETAVLSANCTQFGINQISCTECGAVLKQSVVEATDPVNGHSFEEWTVTQKPSVFNAGTKSRKCSKCDVTQTEEIPVLPNIYTDLALDKWYSKACFECIDKGYMTGTSGTTFSPDSKLSRAQFVQILAKVSGDTLDSIAYTARFTDVPDGKWFTKAVMWCVENGITGGTSATTFSPDGKVTREQLATFFYAYAKSREYDISASANLDKYTDAASISTWAKTALQWTIGEGLISGTSETTLSPKSVATRAQAAVIFNNFAEIYLANQK